MKRFLLFFFLFAYSFNFSQKTDSVRKNHFAFVTGLERGAILPTNIFLQRMKSLNYTGYSVQLLKQTDGEKDWERNFNYPQYGVGFFVFDFVEDDKNGKPFAIYGIYNWKLKEWGKWKWTQSTNFGISFNSKTFDNETNFLNTSVSTKVNMFISLGTGLQYEIGEHFDLGLHLKFNHLSNGAMKIPNKGLNSAAPQISLVYYPQRVVPKKPYSATVNPKKYNTTEFSVFGARKNGFYQGVNREDLVLYDGFNYNVFGTEAYYMRQYSPKAAYGIGVGLTYDEQYNYRMYVQDKKLYQEKRFSKDQLLFSVIPTYRLMINRLYINVGAGYYAFKKKSTYDKFSFFQKLSLQYQISDRFFAVFGINAYDFHRANYLEWKLGYTFSKKERK